MVRFADITWVDADALRGSVDVVLVPVGSTEQHGPHAPLGTDTILAEYLANTVAERTGVIITPAIPIGVSDHHRQFTGTLWVTHQVFREYAKEVALSVASHGWRKVLYVNGHGGNSPSLLEVCEDLRRSHGVFAAVVNAYPPRPDGHAGRDETSIMLNLRPELVKMECAPDTSQSSQFAGIPMRGQGIGPAEYGWDTIDLSTTGVFGAAGKTIRASTATPEHGEKIMNQYVSEVVELVEKLKKARLEELLPRLHV